MKLLRLLGKPLPTWTLIPLLLWAVAQAAPPLYYGSLYLATNGGVLSAQNATPHCGNFPSAVGVDSVDGLSHYMALDTSGNLGICGALTAQGGLASPSFTGNLTSTNGNITLTNGTVTGAVLASTGAITAAGTITGNNGGNSIIAANGILAKGSGYFAGQTLEGAQTNGTFGGQDVVLAAGSTGNPQLYTVTLSHTNGNVAFPAFISAVGYTSPAQGNPNITLGGACAAVSKCGSVQIYAAASGHGNCFAAADASHGTAGITQGIIAYIWVEGSGAIDVVWWNMSASNVGANGQTMYAFYGCMQ